MTAIETALRAGSYAGLVLLVGVAAFWLYVWPEGRRNRVIVQLGWAGWHLSLLTAALLLAAEMARTKSGLLDVIATRAGTSLVVRLALIALAWSWLRELSPTRESALARRPATTTAAEPEPSPKAAPNLRALPGVAVLGLLPLTWVTTGRSVTGHYAAIKAALATLHLVAMAVWLGGLVVLVVILLPRDDPTALHGALPRFSPLAATSVAVLAVTGVAHALAEADGLGRLLHTGYGALVLAKLAAFGVMLLLGNEGRRYTGHRFDALIVGERSRLQILCLAIGAELAIGALVLTLSAALSLAPT
jgi:copper transport protein